MLTGETGAGKSILLDALDALLGGFPGAAGLRLMRSGENRAHIEGLFRINKAVQSWLVKHEFDSDDIELIVSRELIRKDERITNRFRLNGITVNKEQILSIRTLLIDLTAQGQIQNLSDSNFQLNCLDNLGNAAYQKNLSDVRKNWNQWKSINLKLRRLEEEFLDSQAMYQEATDDLQILETANLLDPEEDIKLFSQQDRLANGVALQEGVQSLLLLLGAGTDQVPSGIDLLGTCLSNINNLVLLDESLSTYQDQLLDIIANLQALVRDLDLYSNSIDTNPVALEELQERISLISKLKKRYSLTLEELILKKDKLQRFLSTQNPNEDLRDLKDEEKTLVLERDRSNEKLTAERRLIASKLEKQLISYLNSMGLNHVRFEIRFNECIPGKYGSDCIQFFFSSNPDQPLAPLLEIASGGEMSRFLLALKTTLSSSSSSVLLFDEIDTGVSGRISSAIALLLKKLSIERQVFCVTHQPIVAATADHHLRVSKFVENGVTKVEVSSLVEIEDREQELAELAGGELADARLYASSLLSRRAA